MTTAPFSRQSGSIVLVTLISVLVAASGLYVVIQGSADSQMLAVATDQSTGSSNLSAVQKSIYKLLANPEAGTSTLANSANAAVGTCITTPSPSNCPTTPQPFTLVDAKGDIFISAEATDGISRIYNSTDKFFCDDYHVDGSASCPYKYKLFWTGNSTTGKINVTGGVEVAANSHVKINLEQYNINAAFNAVPSVVGCNPAGPIYGGGTGTSGDPFLICTPAHLNIIGTRSADWNKNFKITEDINMTSVTYNMIASSGSYFTGTIDGGNKTISNLTISGGSDTGFISRADSSAIVKDLSFSNVSINATTRVGTVIGTINFGTPTATLTLSNVKVLSGTITTTTNGYIGGLAGHFRGTIIDSSAALTINHSGTGMYFGGLVGELAESSTITNSTSAGSLWTGGQTSNVGGLVGHAVESTISDSSSSVAISPNLGSTGSGAGGLIGYASKMTITDSFATGPVTQTASVANNTVAVGGLIGQIFGGTVSGTAANKCYSTGAVSGRGFAVGGLIGRASTTTGLGNINLAITNCYSTLNVTNTSTASIIGSVCGTGGLFGCVMSSSPQTSTITNLQYTGIVSGGQRTGGFSGGSSGTTLSISQIQVKTGTTVSGTAYVGGFIGEHSWSALIENSSSDVAVTGNLSVGGFAGLMNNSAVISNSTAAGNVGPATGTEKGGFVGSITSSTINSNSRSSCTVTGTDHTGGFAGMATLATFDNVHATGAVTVTGGNNIGGLIGNASASTVTASTATGLVTARSGTGMRFGGLIGWSQTTTVSASSASGGVNQSDTNTTNYLYMGGLIGRMDGGSVTTSTASGNVTGYSAYVGGLIGQTSAGATVTNCSAPITANVTGNGNGSTPNGAPTGGIIGGTWDTPLSNCTYNGTLIGFSNVGGIIGVATITSVDMTLNQLHSHGNFSLVGTSGSMLGGIFGSISIAPSRTLTVTNISSDAPLTVPTASAGASPGIAGIAAVINASAAGGAIVNFSNCITSGTITGRQYTAGLVGVLNHVTTHPITLNINNCSSTANITNPNSMGSATGNSGGFIGQMGSGATANITNSFYNGTISNQGGTGHGGFVGTGYIVNLTNSYTLGSLSSTGGYVGGFIGSNGGGGTIQNSYTKMNINVSGGAFVGGMAGGYTGTIRDSYAGQATVNGGNYVGGLIGDINGGTIQRNYVSSTVTASTANKGAVIGQDFPTVAADNYFDSTKNPFAAYRSGAGPGGSLGLITTDMYTPVSYNPSWTTANWNLSTSGQYLKLIWEP